MKEVLHAERDVMPEREILGVEPLVGGVRRMAGGAGEINVGSPSPCAYEPFRPRFEEVIPAHGPNVVAPLVPLTSGRGHEDKLVEVDRGVSGGIDRREPQQERFVPPGRLRDLIGIEVHEPVAVEFPGDVLLALQEPHPVVEAGIGVVNDAHESAAPE